MTFERSSLTGAGPRRDRYPDLAGKVAVVTGGSRGIGAAGGKTML
jgi:3-oxoacyl-[acyl-carrier protein] reductase